MTQVQKRIAAILIVIAITIVITLVIPYCGRAEYPFVYTNGDVKELATGVGNINAIATLDKETDIIRLLITRMPERAGKSITIKETTQNEGMLDVMSNTIRVSNTYVVVAYPIRKRNLVVYFDEKPMFMIIRR